MNSWHIPKELEEQIRNRDMSCVYCHAEFDKDSYRSRATWEHIDNNAKHISPSNIVLCCASCNASKGAKSLVDWLESPYCKSKDISAATVAEVVRRSL